MKVALIMTINKSQGQLVKHVGLDLRTLIFSHGELYVTLSQTTYVQFLRVLFPNQNVPKYAFTKYYLIHELKHFFYNILFQHVPFRKDSIFWSFTNTCGSYIMECKLQGFLNDIDVLGHYVEEYSKWNMYDALKMEHFFDNIL